MISIIGNQIRDDILEEVKAAKYFSVIADEVCDVSNKEQLSIALRYTFDSCIKEVFMDFIVVDRITGNAIAKAILQCLSQWNLSLANLRGQCYDGSSNMAGARSGCKAIILQKAPMAVYTHCAAHQLLLVLVRSKHSKMQNLI